MTWGVFVKKIKKIKNKLLQNFFKTHKKHKTISGKKFVIYLSTYKSALQNKKYDNYFSIKVF